MVFVLLVSSASAFLVLKTGFQGRDLDLYGDYAVFEDDERVVLYDIAMQDSIIVAKGSDPSIFAYNIVFQAPVEGKDVIHLSDVKDRRIIGLNLTGRHPHIYSTIVAFSAKESELGVDYDNDGSLDDDIILFHDLDSGETVNTRAVGDFPAVSKDYLVFQTHESAYGNDLTGDKDEDDVVIRSFDFRKRGVHNSALPGERPMITPEGLAAFSSDGEVVIYDVASGDVTRTGRAGSHPWISDDVVLFSSRGELASYDLDNESFARLGIPGSSPVLFDLAAVFVQDGQVRFFRSEDLDDDGIVDLMDNCVHISNVNQTDSDDDGKGDLCDDVEAPVDEEEKVDLVVVDEPEAEPGVEEQEDESSFSWLWFLLFVPIVGFLIWYAPIYWRKRKKSFGF